MAPDSSASFVWMSASEGRALPGSGLYQPEYLSRGLAPLAHESIPLHEVHCSRTKVLLGFWSEFELLSTG